MRSRLGAASLVAASGAFFLSGAAALVYQVTWQRILALQTGVGVTSVALIVAAFMAGLGLGSQLGARASLRLTPRGSLLAFAAIELATAAFGAASPWLYYDVLLQRLSGFAGGGWPATLLQFLGLLPPTVLMGMSLPFLVHAMVRDVARGPRVIALLYGANTLGAALGSLATPWYLIRFLGIRGATSVAAAAGVCVAALALVLARSWSAEATFIQAGGAADAEGSRPAPVQGFGLWAALYAASGFCALALEIVWFRIIDIAVRSTAFSFGTVLAVFLAAHGAGSLAGSRLGAWIRRPLLAFLASQLALLAWAALAVTALVAIPPEAPLVGWYHELWRGDRAFNLGGAWNAGAVSRLYLALPLALFGPPTLLMGFSFSLLQYAVQRDVPRSGFRVGVLQAANIAGGVAGSLLVGLWWLDRFGTTGTLRLLVIGGGVLFAGVGMLRFGRRSAFPALLAGVLAAALLLPSQRALWLPLHGTAAPDAVVAEDRTGLVALVPRSAAGPERAWDMWVDGRSFSTLPYGGLHTLLGAVPALIHPEPRDVAVIGLGSGDTAWAAGLRREATRRIRVFEISAPQRRLLEWLVEAEPQLPKLGRFLDDPRVELRLADGRHALQAEADGYDVIETDALRPSNAYAGNVYSVEFFSLCARRLRDRGVMCTWSPTARISAGLRSVFPSVLELAGGRILLGSHAPLEIDVPLWESRLDDPRVVAYLGVARVAELRACLRTARPLSPYAGPAEGFNQDLHPRDEFNTP